MIPPADISTRFANIWLLLVKLGVVTQPGRKKGVIVMYDTTNYESFEHVPFWLEEIGR